MEMRLNEVEAAAARMEAARRASLKSGETGKPTHGVLGEKLPSGVRKRKVGEEVGSERIEDSMKAFGDNLSSDLQDWKKGRTDDPNRAMLDAKSKLDKLFKDPETN